MINALEDYHTCTICATFVHDYGPGANAVNIDGQWFHRSCRDGGDTPEPESIQFRCHGCGKAVTSPLPADATLRAVAWCPECVTVGRDIRPMRIGGAPYSPDGSETRREIIVAALWDVREHHPHFTVFDVGEYIEAKLALWEAKRKGI